jgi:uncharacterized protein with GYD domain
MMFLTLLKAIPGKAGEQPSFLKRIKIHGVYFLFGRYDGAILFEAPDLRTAKEFLLRVATPTVYRTETSPAIPAEEL